MNLKLYAHPFSSYSQKVLIALYENDIPFEWRNLSGEYPDIYAEFAAMWPIQRFPLLVDGDRPITESTIIIEYLELHYPGPVSLLPANARDALGVRHLDRFFDWYVSTPMQKIVFDAMRPEGEHDSRGVREAHQMLDTAYAWLDQHLDGKTWAAGQGFSLADCSAAPALFYADWVHRIDPSFAHLTAYRKRLLARPSFARAVDEARPYRPLFPLGAPDRD
jgi:glutathione S-transferase